MFKIEKSLTLEKDYKLESSHDSVSWQASHDYAALKGGRLLTVGEARAILEEVGHLVTGDQWIAVSHENQYSK